MTGRERDVAEEDAVLAGSRAGKPLRECAVDLYGREEVEVCWHADSRLRAKLRRMLQRAEARTHTGSGGS